MKEYIRGAQTRSQSRFNPAPKKPKEKDVTEPYMMVSIGRMVQDASNQKAKYDRSLKPIKVPFHSQASYDTILCKCKELLWPREDMADDDDDDAIYYLADGSGTSIYAGGRFELVPITDTAKKEILPWTLQNYLRVSKVKYPSRLRFYVVKAPGTDGHKNKTSDKDTDTDIVSSDCLIDTEDMETETYPGAPDGFFCVNFLEIVRSRYRKAVSFKHGATQHEILSYGQEQGREEKQEIVDYLSTALDEKYHLFNENPLEFGYYLDTITSDDCLSGKVSYRQPDKSNYFAIIPVSRCYACPCNENALLCCVAINGYHPRVSYQWSSNDGRVSIGGTPLLYCDKLGTYKCLVKLGEQERQVEKEFRVLKIGDQLQVNTRQDDSFGTPVENESCKKDVAGIKVLVGDSDLPEIEVSSIRDKDVEVLIIEKEVLVIEKDVLVEKDENDSDEIVLYKSAEIMAIKESLARPSELRFLNIIGCGTFGKVYKAVWRGSIVAAKVIPLSGNEKALENELKVYRGIQHSNVLTLFGVEFQPDSTILITNLVDGPDMNSLLFGDNKIKMSFSDKMCILKQICQAMVFMHECKPDPILHLDLKPANVFVSLDNLHVYVGDFGLAKIKAGTRRTTLSKAGTPGFQAPEQLRGEDIGPHCDVYAFGCITYELFSERPIWDGLSTHAIMFRVAVQGEHPPIIHVHSKVRPVLSNCFAEAINRGTAIDLLNVICDIFLSSRQV